MIKFFLFAWIFCFSALAEASFEIRGWRIPNQTEFNTQKQLEEYVIPDVNGECELRYLSRFHIPESWQFQIKKGENCLKRGYHEVVILDEYGHQRDAINGYFIDGYPIGKTPLNTPVIKRSSPKMNYQEAFYLIDSSASLKTFYIGKMTSQMQDDIYPVFNVCEPFQMVLLSDSRELFKTKAYIDNLKTVVKSYAKTICPEVSKIVFSASDNPYAYESDIFFQSVLDKNEDGSWSEQDEFTFNEAEDNSSEKQLTYDEAKMALSHMKPYHRPALMFGRSRLDIPYVSMRASEVLEKPVSSRFVIHVSRLDEGKIGWADYPFPIEIQTVGRKGWYVVDGHLLALNEFEKKKRGLSLSQDGARMAVTRWEQCTEEQCADLQDINTLLRRMFPKGRGK